MQGTVSSFDLLKEPGKVNKASKQDTLTRVQKSYSFKVVLWKDFKVVKIMKTLD